MSDVPLLVRLDNVFERWGERFNPIVVKETRQAISSRSFPYAFISMLVICVVTTALLIVEEGDRLYYTETGLLFFGWYLGILLVTICLLVPLGLLRSVVSEFDCQTFEMLAITTLTPRKVVFGKLKSAIVQMGAFFSASAPFICFTYLLQGLSIPGILMALGIAFLSGLTSCMGAMMLGALGKQSGWQVFCLLLAVVLGIILIGVGTGLGLTAAMELLGWAGMGSICAGFGCFGYMLLFFSLLTIGVSIAQFTPTMPRPGHAGVVRKRPTSSQLGLPTAQPDGRETSSTDIRG
ncbi:MAG: hypothetical protein ACK5Q5_10330 [Planctomycetaceae bacterium]